MFNAIQAAYESLRERAPLVSFDDFNIAVAECDVHPVTVGRDVVGAIIVKGPEIHACITPLGHRRWFGKKQAAILNAVIRKYGFASTVPTTELGLRFVTGLGFVKRGNRYIKEVPYGT